MSKADLFSLLCSLGCFATSWLCRNSLQCGALMPLLSVAVGTTMLQYLQRWWLLEAFLPWEPQNMGLLCQIWKYMYACEGSNSKVALGWLETWKSPRRLQTHRKIRRRTLLCLSPISSLHTLLIILFSLVFELDLLCFKLVCSSQQLITQLVFCACQILLEVSSLTSGELWTHMTNSPVYMWPRHVWG